MPVASRVAAIYDIHGNLPALEAVLGEIESEGFDEIIVGGDVLPGPMPRETLERLLALETPTRFIMGNGERIVLAKLSGVDSEEIPLSFRENIAWNASQLDTRLAASISAWPAMLEVEIEAVGAVLFCHATPRNDSEIFVYGTEEQRLLPVFAHVSAPTVVCGHTHMQFDRRVGRTRVVNAGSVGMTFGDPGAYWLELGRALRLRRTEYDLVRAAERIRATSYPGAIEFAETNILNPPSHERIISAFASAELK
jgi:predicted phosphodiesterase